MVVGQCSANFSFSETLLTIQFTDQSTHATNDPIVSWAWDFDDNNATSTLQNPMHTFSAADKYDVELIITTASGCSSSIKIRIEICAFSVNYTIGACNTGGQVPVTFNINDLFNNANSIVVTLDGQAIPGSPFNISQANPIITTVNVAGNGLQHELMVQSANIATCQKNTTFITPDCGSNCFLSALNTSYPVGVTKNITVNSNFFSPQSTALTLGDKAHFIWAAGGHSTTSDATSGPNAWNSGVIGQGSTYDVVITNPGVHGYYCIPHGDPNGVGMSGQLLVNCPTGSTLPLVVAFNTSVANSAGYHIKWDGVNVAGSPFSYTGTGPQSKTIQIVGDGNVHTLEIVDVATPSCVISQSYTAPNCNQGGGNPICTLTLTTNNNFGGCNASNQVALPITVNVANGSTSFSVKIDNGAPTSYNYVPNGTTLSINLPGDGNVHTITATDNGDPTCADGITVTTPNCALPCSITNLTASPPSSNGTPSGIVYNVDVQDFAFNPSTVNISSGDVVKWTWVGNVAHTSTSDASGANSWNSGLLNSGSTYTSPVLPQGNHAYYCIPHGGAGGVGMSGIINVLPPCNANNEVNVQVNFNVTSNGTNGYNVLVDGVIKGPFTYAPGNAQSTSVLVPGDGGSHSIQVKDIANASCTASTSVVTPDCNPIGPVCSLTTTATLNGACNAQNKVPVLITVSAMNGGGGCNVAVDGVNVGNFPYTGSNTSFTIEVIGDGLLHNIIVSDDGDPNCTSLEAITTPNCNVPCNITNLVLTPPNTNGAASGIIHNVNVQDFVFNPNTINVTLGDQVKWTWTGNVAHTVTSDVTTGNNAFNSGLLGNGSTFTSPILSQGNHAYYCDPHGAPGGVGMSGIVNVLPPCNANNQVNVVVGFNVVGNGAQGYNVIVDGTAQGPFAYTANALQSATVLVPGDGNSHTLMVQDIAKPACMQAAMVTTPSCVPVTPTCTMTVSATASGPCNAQMQIPYQVTATAVNGSNACIAKLDGTTIGNFPYTSGVATFTINVPGNGQNHLITIEDAANANCAAQQTFTTANCALPCGYTNIVATPPSFTGMASGIAHNVDVADFVFSPSSININLGDVVTWHWVGNIPHTTASDTTSGNQSWNSTLLSNGASFTSPLLSLGTHPYYCIPHGAPGGVGMAGTINVLPPCNINNEVIVQLSFTATSFGDNGYNVLVDGIAQGPFVYNLSGPQLANILVSGNGGSHNITIQDIANPLCVGNTTVTTPSCSSSINACTMSVSGNVSGPCNAQNRVPVQLSINALNTGQNFILSLDGQVVDTSAYTGTNTSYTLLVPGNGSVHTIIVSDLTTNTCNDTLTILTPDCNAPCTVSNLSLTFNTPVVKEILVRDFVFFPKEITANVGDTIRYKWTGIIPHTATSDVATGNNSFNSTLMGNGSVFDVVLHASGDVPYYCIPHGAPGGIGMSGVIHAMDQCLNGQANGTLSFSYSGIASGFNVLVDSVLMPVSPIIATSNSINTSLSLNGDGKTHTLKIVSSSNAACQSQINYEAPNCISPNTCILNIAAPTFSPCTDGNTILSLNITGNQYNKSLDIFKDNVKLNAVPILTDSTGKAAFLELIAGNGLPFKITVSTSDGTCVQSITSTAPNCGTPCLISNLKTVHPAKHRVLVRDFDFSPKNLEILIGDTVQFVWIGDIAHTVTSDAFTGANKFNSGLLSKGSTYNLVLKNTGNHPYYCTPHGGPNGIGMSGKIVVKDTCQLDQWWTNLSFDVNAGSNLGYNVFVNGVKQNTNAIVYDNAKGANIEAIALPGDGNEYFITVQDVETNFCAATYALATPICGTGCSVLDLEAKTGKDITHIVEVRDFDFYPKDITVHVGETIRFIWTGNVPHTVTSDALQGPDVFNSLLLGNGASFDVVIDRAGNHPYYCIPHGGPNGIGQSGNITALPECISNQKRIQYSFNVTNGSTDGYRLYIDGLLYGSNPTLYQKRKGINTAIINVPADDKQHILTIQDVKNNVCAASAFYTVPSCGQDCKLSPLNYDLAIGRKDTIFVRDFDFFPVATTVEKGDTIVFIWTGVVPHTVTSAIQGRPASFNSGLLGKGAVFKLPIDSVGVIEYYCIPHGSPGIGMAGSIQSVGECQDNMVDVGFDFLSSASSSKYDVIVNNVLAINDRAYNNDGRQSFVLQLPANGSAQSIEVRDNADVSCVTQTTITDLNCNDPCFGTIAAFGYTVDYTNLTVDFNDKSKGNMTSWFWEFGDGMTSTQNNTSHTYAIPSTYEVCLTINKGTACEKRKCDKLRLEAEVCEAKFDYDQDGLDLVFYNKSNYADPDALILWSFGDNGSATNVDTILHQYQLGKYKVCITIQSDSCSNTYCKEIDLTDKCLPFKAGFNFEYTSSDRRTINFTNTSSQEANRFLWGFGNGKTSTAKNINHSYSSDGLFNVCLLSQDDANQCSNSICKEIAVGTTHTTQPIIYQRLIVFPNPSIGQSTFNIKGFKDHDIQNPALLQIFNLSGRLIHEQKYKELMPLLTSNAVSTTGQYFVKIIAKNNTYMGMVVVE